MANRKKNTPPALFTLGGAKEEEKTRVFSPDYRFL
jgi:hypothetical protein